MPQNISKEIKCSDCSRFYCFLQRNCETNWLNLLNEFKQTKIYKPGEKIFEYGDISEGIFAIHTGAVKEIIPHKEGDHVIGFASEGMILGYRGYFAADQKQTTSVYTISDAEITFFPKDIFELAISSNPKLANFLISMGARELNRSEMRMINLHKRGTSEAIKIIFAYLIDVFGFDKKESEKLAYNPERKDVANLAGMTYETMTRSISKLKKEGVIDIRDKCLYILKSDYFKQYRYNGLLSSET